MNVSECLAAIERLNPKVNAFLHVNAAADGVPIAVKDNIVTTDMPTIVNLRQDPFERTTSIRGESLNDLGGGYMNDFYAREFWRFVLVQQKVAALAQTAVEYPPMQAPASFNLEAVKAEVQELIKSHEGQ